LLNVLETARWNLAERWRVVNLEKENELLRRHRPKFNRVNTYPPAYNFYRVSRDGATLQLARGTELIESEQTFGAFKSGARCFGPLLRSIWAVLNQPVSAHAFPSPLLERKAPACFAFPLRDSNGATLHQLLMNYLRGASDELICFLESRLPSGDHVSLFQTNLHRSDLDVLRDFFRIGPQRNFQLAQRLGLTSSIIRQDELDDLQVVAR